MSKHTRVIKYSDIILVKNWAKTFLNETPRGVRIEGFPAELDPGDMLALAYIDAVLNLMNAEHVKIVLTTANSDSINE